MQWWCKNNKKTFCVIHFAFVLCNSVALINGYLCIRKQYNVIMEHHHHHHDHITQVHSLSGVFVLSIVLNTVFVGVEAAIGLYHNSLSLLSDAGHNLSDVFSLILVLVAFKLSKVHANRHFTYGYRKSTVLISLLNASLLLVAVGAIIVESCHKFVSPSDVNGVAVSWTAGVGIIVNGVTALLLMKGQKEDLNVRGAFLHMAADTLVSVGVLISGMIISATGWNIVDPIVSLIIAVVILVSTWHLFSASLRLSMDGTPEHIEPAEVLRRLCQVPNVTDVHHLHVWAISTTENALTAHVVIPRLELMNSVKCDIKHELEHLNICHSTLEFELSGTSCPDCNC